MSNSTRYVSPETLYQFAQSVFVAVGFDTDNAAVIAKSLVDAELRGKESHGIIRLSHYVERIEAGGMETQPEVSVQRTRDSTAIVDGDGGPGQIASQRAIEEGTALAKEEGVGIIGVERSNHFGTVSYYTNQAAKEGCIAIGVSHGGPIVVPYGGAEPFLSTNPFCISVPSEDFPVNLDISTSATALGNIFIADEEGSQISPDWAIDEQGLPTTDPEAFNALRPMAGHKGYGLAFMIDVLCGVLLSGTFGSDVSGLYDDIESPQNLAHLFLVFDVAAFTDIDTFKSRIEALITNIKSVPVRDEFDVEEIYVPGEQSHQTKQERQTDGIPIRSDVWQELGILSETYDISPPSEM